MAEMSPSKRQPWDLSQMSPEPKLHLCKLSLCVPHHRNQLQAWPSHDQEHAILEHGTPLVILTAL